MRSDSEMGEGGGWREKKISAERSARVGGNVEGRRVGTWVIKKHTRRGFVDEMDGRLEKRQEADWNEKRYA